MSTKTSIEWTDRTWNPTRGCSRVSPGCDHCYAMREARRHDHRGGSYEGLTRVGARGVDWSGRVRLVPEMLDEPLTWRKPQRVFVNSMSDLFHESLTFEEINAVFAAMAMAPRHRFQVLTKRPENMLAHMRALAPDPAEFLVAAALQHDPLAMEDIDCTLANVINGWSWWSGVTPAPPPSRLDGTVKAWPLPNVWLGVSVEDQATADERIPLLLQTPAAVRFVSYEPALGPVDFNPCGVGPCSGWLRSGEGPRLNWLIVGGESGPGARPFDLAWARSAVAQCKAAGVPVFVKQLGARPLRQRQIILNPGESLDDLIPLHGERNGRAPLLDRKGGDPSEWPEDLRVRGFPA